MKMSNFLYRHDAITPYSGNVKIQEIVPFTKKQDSPEELGGEGGKWVQTLFDDWFDFVWP